MSKGQFYICSLKAIDYALITTDSLTNDQAELLIENELGMLHKTTVV